MCLARCVFSSEFRIEEDLDTVTSMLCDFSVLLLEVFSVLLFALKIIQEREGIFIKALPFRLWCWRLRTGDESWDAVLFLHCFLRSKFCRQKKEKVNVQVKQIAGYLQFKIVGNHIAEFCERHKNVFEIILYF